MVCHRCVLAVQDILEQSGYTPLKIELGEAILSVKLSKEEKTLLNEQLIKLGFSIIDDKKSQIIEQIKNLVIEIVQKHDCSLKTNLSDFLSKELHHDYSFLTGLFTEVEGNTIEKYFISQKIERVKELLVYDELTLSEIAFKLNYSSVAHLSHQFKKVTGLTPSYYKNLGKRKRKPLDEV